MVLISALQRAWDILVRGRLDELEEIEEPDREEHAARVRRQSLTIFEACPRAFEYPGERTDLGNLMFEEAERLGLNQKEKKHGSL